MEDIGKLIQYSKERDSRQKKRKISAMTKNLGEYGEYMVRKILKNQPDLSEKYFREQIDLFG